MSEIPRQLTTKEILKYIGERIVRMRMTGQSSSQPMYYAGMIDGMLEIEEFILNVNAAFKQVAVYEKEVECQFCGVEFTAELEPGDRTAVCPVCSNKTDVYD